MAWEYTAEYLPEFIQMQTLLKIIVGVGMLMAFVFYNGSGSGVGMLQGYNVSNSGSCGGADDNFTNYLASYTGTYGGQVSDGESAFVYVEGTERFALVVVYGEFLLVTNGRSSW